MEKQGATESFGMMEVDNYRAPLGTYSLRDAPPRDAKTFTPEEHRVIKFHQWAFWIHLVQFAAIVALEAGISDGRIESNYWTKVCLRKYEKVPTMGGPPEFFFGCDYKTEQRA